MVPITPYHTVCADVREIGKLTEACAEARRNRRDSPLIGPKAGNGGGKSFAIFDDIKNVNKKLN